VNLTMSPLPQAKRKLKYNEADIGEKEDSPDDSSEEGDSEAEE